MVTNPLGQSDLWIFIYLPSVATLSEESLCKIAYRLFVVFDIVKFARFDGSSQSSEVASRLLDWVKDLRLELLIFLGILNIKRIL